MTSATRWALRPEVAGVGALQQALGLPLLVSRLLAGRGYASPEEAQRFLSSKLAELPDPRLLKGAQAGAARLVRAIRTGETICAYGDYDVDGVTSTALLTTFLRELGATVVTYVPHRLHEGYGLNVASLPPLVAQGVKLLVTLDCGITARDEIAEANRLGLQVVVVDHHTAPAELPDAHAILNPWQPGCDYPTKHLCAVGVTFLLCAAVRRQLREEGFFVGDRREPELRRLLDLVALGTIADVVPLTGANRIFVKAGLLELGRAERPGVRALKRVAGMEATAEVMAGQVGFRLGPRINAAGRLDDAGRALELLLSDDLATCERLARELDRANAVRQALEKGILAGALAAALADESAWSNVLWAEGWHPGVVGIVASRVVEKTHRPTLVIGVDPATGLGKGSGRSVEGFHLHDALQRCAARLVRFGGHRHAVGLTVKREELEGLRAAFEAHARSVLTEEQRQRTLRLDGLVEPAELGFPLFEALQALAPFGAGNPEPVFALRRAEIDVRPVGATGDHLKLKLKAAPGLDAIAFGQGERAALARGPVDLAFTLGRDDYRGGDRVQLRVKEFRAAGELG